MYHTVYVTTCPESGKYYIGKHSTNDTSDGYKGSGIWILNCRKLKRNLVTETIAIFPLEKSAYDFEEFLIAQHKGKPLCMNMRDGGLISVNRESKYSPTKEHREKLSKSRTGMKFSEEHKRKLSEARRSWSFSPEQKKMLSMVNPRTKWVVCLRTGMVFRGTRECAKFWGVSNKTVSAICRGDQKSKIHKFEYME